jgi:UDP-N-acetylglucosamine acyltransferase
MSDDTLKALRSAYRILFQSGLRLAEAVERIRAELGTHAEVQHLARFVTSSQRGICR